MMNKIFTITAAVFAALMLTACPGGGSSGDGIDEGGDENDALKSAPADQINADNALEEADKILEDIENL